MTRRGAVGPKGGPTLSKKASGAAKAKPRLAVVETEPVAAVLPDSAPPDSKVEDPAPLRLAPELGAATRPPLEVRRARLRKAMAAGLILACIGGGVVGVAKVASLRGHRLPPVGPTVPAANLPASAQSGPTVEARPILADYRPPDRDEVSRAYVNAGAVYRSEGLSGVVRQTMDCFSGLEQTPSYATLDYCIALDAYGAALHRQLAGDQAPGPDSYFGSAAARELKAARAVVATDGDPGARVMDVRRLAGEVSQAGPAAAALAVASAADASAQRAASTVASNQIASNPAPASAPAAPVLVVAEAAPPHVAAPAVRQVAAASVEIPLEPHRVQARAEPTPPRVRSHPETLKASIPARAKPQKIAEPEFRPSPRARVEKTATSKSRHELRLTKASAHVQAKPARPKISKAELREARRSSQAHLTRASARETYRPAPSRMTKASTHSSRNPFDPRRIVASIRAHFTPHPAPHPARTTRVAVAEPVRRPTHPAPLKIAARGRFHDAPRERFAAVDRRASEPAEWVDCRHPRTNAEFRMCEGGGSGDGSLESQFQHGRNRNR
jgi:hypothetical protein